MTPPRPRALRLAALAVPLVVAGGCAQRRLITAPDSPTGWSTWTPVWLAAVLAAVVLGLLLTLPAWRSGAGSRLAVAVLGAHAGGVVLGGIVLVGAAVRSWQLIDRPAGAAPEPALLPLGGSDGDTAFFALVVLVTVVVGVLLTLLALLAARFAATDDLVLRSVACAVLAAEILASGYALARFAAGHHEWPYLLGAAQVPLAVVAFVACWPRDPQPDPRQ